VGEKRRYVTLGLVVLLGILGVRTMVRNADWQNDVTLFLAAIHDGNRSAKVYYNLGVGYRKQGQYGEALKAFEQLAALKADDAGSWKYLGIVYAEQNRYVESAEAYARAVALDSTQVDLWKRLGEMSVKSEKWSDAEVAFEHVLTLHADDVDARFELAKMFYRLGNLTGAVRQCEVLLSEYVFDHRLATVLLGKLYIEVKRYADAQMLVQSAYLRWPEDEQVHVLMGELQKMEKW
jgi:tetratricopeptide (TPR) repeat protein